MDVSPRQKRKPKLLLIPTPLGDDRRWVEFWEKQLAPQLDCEFSALRTFDDSPNMKAHQERVMNADVIFVTGGNTLNALAVWKAQGIDTSLRQAWEKGIVLGGESAGMISWFEEGWSDSRPEKLSVVNGLGFLPGSACPHYENPQRRESYQAAVASGAIKGGYGCHGGTALIYRGTALEKVVSIDAASSVFRVTKGATAVTESPVDLTVI
jgi:dipeptidase E